MSSTHVITHDLVKVHGEVAAIVQKFPQIWDGKWVLDLETEKELHETGSCTRSGGGESYTLPCIGGHGKQKPVIYKSLSMRWCTSQRGIYV